MKEVEVKPLKAKGTAAFARVNRRLMDSGYAVAPNHYMHQSDSDAKDYGEYVHSLLTTRSDVGGNGNKDGRNRMPFLMHTSGSEVGVSDDIGSKGKGFITWGADNRIPNCTALLTGMLPYTAAGHKFNTDLLASMGPEPMYHSVRYQLGGGLIREDIPYQDAGVFIKGLIRDLRLQRLKLTESNDEPSIDEFGNTVIDNSPSPLADDDPLIKEIDDQIMNLQKDYAKWEHDAPEIDAFCEATGNNLCYLCLSTDEQLLGMCFPELDLNQVSTTKDDEGNVRVTPTWQPKVQAIRYRPAHICRLERKDDDGKINYVYISNRFYDQPIAGQDKIWSKDITALPALSPENPLDDLKEHVRNARQKRVAVKKRPTRFILPVSYPTSGKPYYPVPAWHSIFTGDVYEFASTLISDRYTRKKNANVIGRIIYIHNDFLNALYTQQTTYEQEAKAKGKKYVMKTKEQLRDDMYKQINDFLRNPDNSGQSLVAFVFTGTDGKDHESFKIVEIESTSKNNADANQTELLEISSIIFFAMGLDSTLVGNTPGKTGTNSGTDLRTRYLMKQIQMSPTQKLLLKPWEVASRFNDWDKHLVWQVRREVITTLDNSKTGVTEAKNDNE